ncbi:MAG: FAD-dependent oxidoreductase [Gemmiger sp.]|nr:FAD-dependent oxidoreductase [Gemmiger sp.]
MKTLIVGGVAGGASAAARLRRLDEKMEIVLLERGGYISYANCGLPYYIGGEITEREALTLQTPESFRTRFAVDVRVGHEAVAIDRAGKTVRVRTAAGTSYEEHYDTLLLAPGAKPALPPVEGLDAPQVVTLRTLEDACRIEAFIRENQPKTAAIVGGGAIGLEMAENLHRAGLAVTVVEAAAHVAPMLDADVACELTHCLLRNGVHLETGRRIQSVGELNADLVLLCAGVKPESELAAQAGLALGVRGTIVVDEHMRTADPAIYAVGDAVQVQDLLTGADAFVPLAGPANRQGRIAADNICGHPTRYVGSQGSCIFRTFGTTAACTGLNEAAAQRAGIGYDKVFLWSPSHAGYYPGADFMSLKVLFAKQDGKILGAQAVGGAGVDKRIDVLATAIRAGLNAAALAELELAYAPPFSSAKDPVNMAGFMIGNLLDGTVHQYHWHDVPGLQARGDVALLDVRTAGEYARGHIEGAVNLPLDELRGRLGELDAAKPLYVNCQSGLRSYIACRILAQNGFTCHNLAGGYRLYASVMKEQDLSGLHTAPCGAMTQQEQNKKEK